MGPDGSACLGAQPGHEHALGGRTDCGAHELREKSLGLLDGLLQLGVAVDKPQRLIIMGGAIDASRLHVAAVICAIIVAIEKQIIDTIRGAMICDTRRWATRGSVERRANYCVRLPTQHRGLCSQR